MADDGSNVETILQLAEHLRVAIDDRNLVGLFTRKAIGSRAANLPRAQNQNLHAALPRRNGA